MKIDASDISYRSTLGEVPIGTVVIITSGQWMGKVCIVAFDEEMERSLAVKLADGEASELDIGTACMAYPAASLRLMGWPS